MLVRRHRNTRSGGTADRPPGSRVGQPAFSSSSVSSAGTVTMQSWPLRNSHTCDGAPLGCTGGTGRRVTPGGVLPTQWMWVRGIASRAGLSSRTGCWKQRTDSSESIVRSQSVSAGSVTPNRPMGAGLLRHGRDAPGRAGSGGGFDQVPGHGYDVEDALAIGRDHRVEVDQPRYPVRDLAYHGGDDHPGVAVPHQYHVAQLVLHQEGDDVGDMGVEADVRTEQVLLLAVTGQRGGEDPVPGPGQQGDHPVPDAPAVPGAVDKDVVLRARCTHGKDASEPTGTSW